MEVWERFRAWSVQIPPLAWVGIMLLTVVALGIAATSIGAVARFDANVVRELQGEVSVRELEDDVFAVTDLAGSPMLLATIIVAGTLLLVQRWRAALVLVITVALTKAVVAIAKELIERDRPETAFEEYGTFSFPSGHAASAAALYMTLAVLLAREHSRAVRILVVGVGAVVTFAVGATRVLIGAHFPTDVLAGWLVGGLLGLGVWALVVRLAGHPPQPQESTGEHLRHALVAREDEVSVRLPDDARL